MRNSVWLRKNYKRAYLGHNSSSTKLSFLTKMQISKATAAIILSYIALTSAAPATAGNFNQTHPFTSKETAQIHSLVSGLNDYNTAHKVPGYTKRDEVILHEAQELIARSNLPILDKILIALKDSGLANVVIDFVLLSPELLDISANATIFILKSGLINLTDLLIAIEKSGLVNQLILLALDDPEILPGLLRIGKELLKQNGIDIFSKRSMDTSAIETASVFEELSLDKRESQLLNELFASLRDSGLVASIVQNLLTNPDLASPAATFLTKIIKSHAITLKELLQALKESHFIFNVLKDVLTDKAILEKFGELVFERISKGIISKSMFDNA